MPEFEKGEIIETARKCISYNGMLHGRNTESGIRYCELSRLTNDMFCQYLSKKVVRKIERTPLELYVAQYRVCEYRKKT